MKRDVDILAFGAAVLHQDLRDSFGDFSLLVGGASLDPRNLHMRHRLSSFDRLRSTNCTDNSGILSGVWLCGKPDAPVLD